MSLQLPNDVLGFILYALLLGFFAGIGWLIAVRVMNKLGL